MSEKVTVFTWWVKTSSRSLGDHVWTQTPPPKCPLHGNDLIQHSYLDGQEGVVMELTVIELEKWRMSPFSPLSPDIQYPFPEALSVDKDSPFLKMWYVLSVAHLSEGYWYWRSFLFLPIYQCLLYLELCPHARKLASQWNNCGTSCNKPREDKRGLSCGCRVQAAVTFYLQRGILAAFCSALFSRSEYHCHRNCSPVAAFYFEMKSCFAA